jgi:hypothetical protein
MKALAVACTVTSRFILFMSYGGQRLQGLFYYSPLPGEMLRTLLAVVFIAATALAFLLLSNRRRTMLGFLIVFAVLVVFSDTRLQ